MNIQRFSVVARLFHLFVMLTFLTEASTGFGRLYFNTGWGKQLCRLLGGYESCGTIHRWVGVLMIGGFVAQIILLLSRIRWRNLNESVFGPDSLVPNLTDMRQLWQRIKWSMGLCPPPELDRWSYWEKFDYWAVFWGMPLLGLTGLMMMYPVEVTLMVPGWTLNIAGLLHRAEALLAAGYVFLVHFFVIHFRPTVFPLNESIFSGSVPLEEAIKERPAWVERLAREGKLEAAKAKPPPLAFRIAYFVFGYSVVGIGLYLIINGIAYSRHVSLH